MSLLHSLLAGELSPEQVLQALQQVFDPELGVNIVDLGLVYGVEVEGNRVRLRMTMTTPACPLGGYLEEAVRRTLRQEFPTLHTVAVEWVWEPPWSPERMSPEARKQLGWEG